MRPLLMTLLALAACAGYDGMNDQCRFGGDVPTERACADGWFCDSNGYCHEASHEGQACGEQCAAGLYCDGAKICRVPGATGVACDATTLCETALGCLYGEPDIHHGVCGANNQLGQPCTWRFIDDGVGNGSHPETAGCATDLTCIPNIPTFDPLAPGPPAAVEICGDRTCGMVGRCASPGRVSAGEPCLSANQCSSTSVRRSGEAAGAGRARTSAGWARGPEPARRAPG